MQQEKINKIKQDWNNAQDRLYIDGNDHVGRLIKIYNYVEACFTVGIDVDTTYIFDEICDKDFESFSMYLRYLSGHIQIINVYFVFIDNLGVCYLLSPKQVEGCSSNTGTSLRHPKTGDIIENAEEHIFIKIKPYESTKS